MASPSPGSDKTVSPRLRTESTCDEDAYEHATGKAVLTTWSIFWSELCTTYHLVPVLQLDWKQWGRIALPLPSFGA